MISLSCLLYTVNPNNPHVSPENDSNPSKFTDSTNGKNQLSRYNPLRVESFLTSLGHLSAGGCTEIRIFPKSRYLKINGRREYMGKTVAGYYTDYAKAAKDIADFDGNAQIYVTLNPCDLKLMRRAHNRLQFNVENTAQDVDIIQILWLPLDLDPVRPKGTSSSDDELQAAQLRFDLLHSEVFAPHNIPVSPGMSGNGAHGLIRIKNCPNNSETQALVKRFLDFLKSKYSDDVVHVDSSVSNPSRIWKVYGTMACKGDNTPVAPHRRADIERPSEIKPIDLSSLVAVIPKAASSEKKQEKASGTGNPHMSGRFLSDSEIIGKLLREKDGAKWERLLNGDTRDYPSQSEADAALVFKLAFYTKDAVQIDRLFRRSGLMYEKWDEKHYADGRTYGQKLIDDALQKVTGQYDPNSRKQKQKGSRRQKANGNGSPSGNGKQKKAEKSASTTPPEEMSQELDDWIPYSDTYTADRVVFRHGKDIRWCDVWQRWLVWDGRRWTFDDTQQVKRFVEETIRHMIPEAQWMDIDATQKFLSYIKGALGQNRIEGVTRALQRKVPILPKDLDTDPMWLNCLDGTIDLRTGKLREHRREDYITKVCPVRIKTAENPSARDVELFSNFLRRILPDPELRAFVQRAIGYSITGKASEEVLFFPFGPTATGKSTLLAAVQAALGDYAATADFETLLADAKASGRPKTELARLAGKRFVVSVEVNKGVRLAEGLLKWITGQDQVVARFLYGNEFEFLPSFTLWLAANHRPKATDDDDALWRRILQMPFSSQIPKAERDPTIKERLRDPEQFGAIVLAWAVEGCLEWQKQGLGVPEAVEQTTAEYRQEMNPIGDFIKDCCVVKDGTITTSRALWDAYSKWADENGIKYPLKRRAFGQRLEAMGFRSGREYLNGKLQRVFLGIGILESREHDTYDTYDTTFDNFSKTDSTYGELSDVASYASYASQMSDSKDPESPPSERGQGESEAYSADDNKKEENTGEELTREQKIVHIHDAEDGMKRPRTHIDSSWNDSQISTVYNMWLERVMV